MGMNPQSPPDVLLEVRNMHTHIRTRTGIVRAVNGVSFSLRKGEVLGLAGESGSGKSLTAYSIMKLLPNNASVTADVLRFKGEDLLSLPPAGMRKLRGDRMAMVFQDPMTSLNPVFTVGDQIAEVLIQHRNLSRQAVRVEVARLMEAVGLPAAAARYGAYPHEFSGGMRQRIVIAMALACSPDLLIADEPTTALDVTIERQILALLRRMQQEVGSAVLLITHNLGLIEEYCDRVAVLYGGEVVELASAATLFSDPRHPYTRALLQSVPRGPIAAGRLQPLGGAPPILTGPQQGCCFAPRCPARMPRCVQAPAMHDIAPGHQARCHLHEPTA